MTDVHAPTTILVDMDLRGGRCTKKKPPNSCWKAVRYTAQGRLVDAKARYSDMPFPDGPVRVAVQASDPATCSQPCEWVTESGRRGKLSLEKIGVVGQHNNSNKPKKASSAPKKALPVDCKMWGDVYADAQPVKGGVARQNVRATYHYYSPGYETSSLACADRFWADPGHGRKLLKYPWTAYCLGGRSFSQDTCGKCLKITNARTGASVIARAVDNGGCSDADGTGLDLDPCAFNAIDTDGQGLRDGNMRVNVQEVTCGADGTMGRS